MRIQLALHRLISKKNNNNFKAKYNLGDSKGHFDFKAENKIHCAIKMLKKVSL